jgi:hypothetical protein
MKRIFALWIVALFILSSVAVVFAREGEQGGILSSDDTEDDDSEDTVTSSSQASLNSNSNQENSNETELEDTEETKIDDNSDEARYNRCYAFAKSKNQFSNRPAALCNEIIKGEDKCIQYLNSNNVENATQTCSKIFTKVGKAVALQAAWTTRVAEHRIERIKNSVKDANNSKFVDSLSEENGKKFSVLTRAEQKKILEKNNVSLLSKYKLVKTKIQNLFKERVIAKNKLDKAEERFKEAKKNYEKAELRYEKNKMLFLNAKDKFKECKNNQSDTCKQLEQKIMNHTRDYLNDRVEMIIEYLTKIREKVDGSESIPNNESVEILAKIDAALTELKEIQTKIDSAKTKEDIQVIVKEINALWKKMKVHAFRYATRLMHARVGEIIERSEHLEDKLDCALQKMQEQNISVSGIQIKVNEFSTKIDSAKTNYNKAVTWFKEVKDMRDDTDKNIESINAKMQEAKKLMTSAQVSLKEAHTLLVQIVKDIKAEGGKITACDVSDSDLAADEAYVIEDTTATI